jgi:hypothetical protein
MYPQVSSVQQGLGPSSGAPPQQPGIATALQDLNAVVCHSTELANQLRGALGLQRPVETQGKDQPASALDMMNDLRIRLMAVNQDVDAVICHINS